MTKWILLPALPAIAFALTGCASTSNMLPFKSSSVEAVSTADRQLSMARLGERHGQTDTAVKIYHKVLEDNPKNSEAMHRLGVIAARGQDHDQAIQYLAQAEQLDPNNAELLNDYGYALFLVDATAAAEAKLRKAIQLEPYHKAAHNNLGLVLGQQERWDESLAAFKMAVDDAEAYANLAFIQVQSGELAQAEKNFHLALDIDQDLQPAAEGLVQLTNKKDLMEKQFVAKWEASRRGSPSPSMQTRESLAEIQPIKPEPQPSGAIPASQFAVAREPRNMTADEARTNVLASAISDEVEQVEVVSHESQIPQAVADDNEAVIVEISEGRSFPGRPLPVRSEETESKPNADATAGEQAEAIEIPVVVSQLPPVEPKSQPKAAEPESSEPIAIETPGEETQQQPESTRRSTEAEPESSEPKNTEDKASNSGEFLPRVVVEPVKVERAEVGSAQVRRAEVTPVEVRPVPIKEIKPTATQSNENRVPVVTAAPLPKSAPTVPSVEAMNRKAAAPSPKPIPAPTTSRFTRPTGPVQPIQVEAVQPIRSATQPTPAPQKKSIWE